MAGGSVGWDAVLSRVSPTRLLGHMSAEAAGTVFRSGARILGPRGGRDHAGGWRAQQWDLPRCLCARPVTPTPARAAPSNLPAFMGSGGDPGEDEERRDPDGCSSSSSPQTIMGDEQGWMWSSWAAVAPPALRLDVLL